MERQEKTEFILEQMRLSIAKEDYIRTQIIAKKINIRFFSETSSPVQQLKIRFYKLMIQLSEHDKNFLETEHIQTISVGLMQERTGCSVTRDKINKIYI